MVEMKTVYHAVLNGDAEIVAKAVRLALSAGVPAGQILSDALIPAMTEVGHLFETHEYYVPEIMISAEAMQTGLSILRPMLGAASVRSVGRIAIGSVEGDLHDIGKNLVITMLEGSGFDVVDLGVDVCQSRFVQAARDGAQVIGMSAMIPTTMPGMKLVIEALKAEGLRERVKVIVGGALLTQEYSDLIEADGYASDASMAVRKVKKLLSEMSGTERRSESADRANFSRIPETISISLAGRGFSHADDITK
jgi:5-methyltetrahydrofolate--homocysteine methyltransferase